MAENKISIVRKKALIPTYFKDVIIPENKQYYGNLRVTDKQMIKCPFHEEQTPSLRYYSETNTFNCFGCGANGGIIELHSKYMEKTTGIKPSENESADLLYREFVRVKTEI